MWRLLVVAALIAAAHVPVACRRDGPALPSAPDGGEHALAVERSDVAAPEPPSGAAQPTIADDTHAPSEDMGADIETVAEGGEDPTAPAVVVTVDPASPPSIAKAAASEPDGFDLRGIHTGLGEAPDAPPPEPEDPRPDPDANVDRTWSERDDDVPTFPDDDPLLASGIPLCRALVEGVRACRPKLDAELRTAIDPLIAAILNGARSLRRSIARTRACEMGWAALPEMLEKYCPGAFDPSFPRSVPTE